MEVLLALWVPESAPLLTSIALLLFSSSSAIGMWLVAVSAIAVEVVWARLPADWTVSEESWIALVIAQVLISVLISGARGNRDP